MRPRTPHGPRRQLAARSPMRPAWWPAGRGTRSRDAIYGAPDQRIARGLRTASSGMLRRWHLTSIKPIVAVEHCPIVGDGCEGPAEGFHADSA
jgi:hypothetical protein